MKIVFFGSSKFVIPIIEVLRKNFDLALVVTTEKFPTDPVLSYCNTNKIPSLSVSNLSDPNFIRQLGGSTFEFSLGVLASFGSIIPNEVLNLFPKGIINIHPSLLPRYRGPTPVQTAILNGDKKTGVTIIKLDKEVDHGAILFQTKENILPNDTNESLYERLFKLGAGSIVSTIELYLKGKIKLRKQNHAKATFTKRLTREDGYVDISKLNPFDKLRVGHSAELSRSHAERSRSIKTQNSKLLNRMIRAYYPWPGVWTRIGIRNNESGIRDKILKFLPKKKIQVEGRKPMSYKDFINGYPKIGKEILTKLEIN